MNTIAFGSLAIIFSILLYFWIKNYGLVRGGLALFCRVAWVLPIFLALIPATKMHELPRSLSTMPIRVFVDDSESVSHSVLESTLQNLKSECIKIGCALQIDYLSKINSLTEKGFSPLSDVLNDWLDKDKSSSWIILTDAQDYKPTIRWKDKISPLLQQKDRKKGVIYAIKADEEENFWVENIDIPAFSFETEPLVLNAYLRRNKISLSENVRIQIQVLLEGKVLVSTNTIFRKNEENATVEITVPALPQGQHLLTLNILPTRKEKNFWDNKYYAHIESLPDKVGVLHLLGSPSPDGRFLRRYLKAEPKYDLISFFILRDPWDQPFMNERELSLIPFPVDKLFNEELSKFKLVILQNFDLLQFLMPEYQKNLVKFVREGGGLLFIGGERSLKLADIKDSPLQEILPFTLKKNNEEDRAGPFYDAQENYSLVLGKPTMHQRALADVYDEWEKIYPQLSTVNLFGLHHTENVTFLEDTTPLLNATVNGQNLPFAVASYPDKGRAIWIFSDSSWRLALNAQLPREVYSKVYKSAFDWLLRREFKKPLVINNLSIFSKQSADLSFSAYLSGPSVRYLIRDPSSWRVKLCDQTVASQDLLIESQGVDYSRISGKIDFQNKEYCSLQIVGENKAFGSVYASDASPLASAFKDSEMTFSEYQVKSLAESLQASVIYHGSDWENIAKWVDSVTNKEGVYLPPRYEVLRDPFFILDSPYIWLVLVFVVLEVILRRWQLLR